MSETACPMGREAELSIGSPAEQELTQFPVHHAKLSTFREVELPNVLL